MKWKLFLSIIAISFLVSLSSSQNIKLENGMFKVVNYTLVEGNLIYRIYDVNTKVCVSGGEMYYTDFYEGTYFPEKPGIYEIVIYQKPNRVFIREMVEKK